MTTEREKILVAVANLGPDAGNLSKEEIVLALQERNLYVTWGQIVQAVINNGVYAVKNIYDREQEQDRIQRARDEDRYNSWSQGR